MGVWMDWNNPYMTLDPKYMESSWWMLKRANEQDLLVNNIAEDIFCVFDTQVTVAHKGRMYGFGGHTEQLQSLVKAVK